MQIKDRHCHKTRASCLQSGLVLNNIRVTIRLKHLINILSASRPEYCDEFPQYTLKCLCLLLYSNKIIIYNKNLFRF